MAEWERYKSGSVLVSEFYQFAVTSWGEFYALSKIILCISFAVLIKAECGVLADVRVLKMLDFQLPFFVAMHIFVLSRGRLLKLQT